MENVSLFLVSVSETIIKGDRFITLKFFDNITGGIFTTYYSYQDFKRIKKNITNGDLNMLKKVEEL